MTNKEWLRNIIKKEEEKQKEIDFFICEEFILEDLDNGKNNLS